MVFMGIIWNIHIKTWFGIWVHPHSFFKVSKLGLHFLAYQKNKLILLLGALPECLSLVRRPGRWRTCIGIWFDRHGRSKMFGYPQQQGASYGACSYGHSEVCDVYVSLSPKHVGGPSITRQSSSFFLLLLRFQYQASMPVKSVQEYWGCITRFWCKQDISHSTTCAQQTSSDDPQIQQQRKKTPSHWWLRLATTKPSTAVPARHFNVIELARPCGRCDLWNDSGSNPKSCTGNHSSTALHPRLKDIRAPRPIQLILFPKNKFC